MLGLITPTSDRPEAFALCERWMQRAIAHFGQPVRWVVIDDGETPVRSTQGQVVIRREPSATAAESFLGNVAAGLEAVAGCDKILIVEDDEWYAPEYITVLAHRLDEADLVGEARARYYSVHDQRYWIWENDSHASFAQTGFRESVRLPLRAIIDVTSDPFIDQLLWRLPVRKNLAEETRLSLGIKGLPGKSGFTDGHRGRNRLPTPDHTAEILAGWIGGDANAYQPYSRLRTSSIIVPCHSRWRELEQTLPLMLRQEHRSNVVIVGNGSLGGTSEFLRDMPGVQVVPDVGEIESPSLGRARNTGIRSVDSHWCVMADAETLMPPDYVGGLIADCLRHDWQLCCASTNGTINSQCCVSRSAWDVVGGYDEAITGGRSEDRDFYARLEAAGIRCGKREGCGLA